MKTKHKQSIDRISKSIYPLRILGFYLFAISIVLSQLKLGSDIDYWCTTGIVICLVYPHIIFMRAKYTRGEETQYMVMDLALLGVMTALVNFTPMIALPFLIANSAASLSIGGIKQSFKGISAAILAFTIIGLLRNESIVLQADLYESIGPMIYLIVVMHYMGYLAYVRGMTAHSRGVKLISRRKEAEILAQLDFLTGLNNRRSMFHKVKLNDEKTKTNNDNTTLIMIDLDNFKQINDTYGHDHGDEVLVQISKLMQKSLRGTDIIARWGGEEFLILLPNTDIEEGLTIAEKLRENIANNSIHYASIEHNVTATLGISSYNIESNFEQAIKYADDALYKGKEGGRNRVIS